MVFSALSSPGTTPTPVLLLFRVTMVSWFRAYLLATLSVPWTEFVLFQGKRPCLTYLVLLSSKRRFTETLVDECRLPSRLPRRSLQSPRLTAVSFLPFGSPVLFQIALHAVTASDRTVRRRAPTDINCMISANSEQNQCNNHLARTQEAQNDTAILTAASREPWENPRHPFTEESTRSNLFSQSYQCCLSLSLSEGPRGVFHSPPPMADESQKQI